MKNIVLALSLGSLLLLSSCTTINLTSWKDTSSDIKVDHVVVLALFEKLEYTKAMEENVAEYFNAKSLKCTKALDFMAPNQEYSNEELKHKVEAYGADAILIFVPKGADKSVNYTPPTYSGYYRGYRGGVYSVSPGYYSESTTYHVQANLYAIEDEKLIWTGDISTTDPASIDKATFYIAQKVYDDWQKNSLISVPAKNK